MASLRSWRPQAHFDGPHRARTDDIKTLNVVFSDAFTERYRRDGLVGVRVPHLNPQVWRYAIEDAAEGAMVWRDLRGDIAAFNMVHRSGVEGWMGPLAVRTEYQGTGAGKEVVARGVKWLQDAGARVIGLETMPRTMDNIGFYSGLGFLPGKLTITLTLDGASSDQVPDLLSRAGAHERDDALIQIRALTEAVAPGYDFTREIALTHSLGLGDTVLIRDKDVIVGFALCHYVPLVDGRARDELRVLKLALASEQLFDPVIGALRDLARRSGTARVAIRVQGDCANLYRHLVAKGARVRWTDLRMALNGYAEQPPARGVLLSNWEI